MKNVFNLTATVQSWGKYRIWERTAMRFVCAEREFNSRRDYMLLFLL